MRFFTNLINGRGSRQRTWLLHGIVVAVPIISTVVVAILKVDGHVGDRGLGARVLNDLDWTAGDDDEDQVALRRRGRALILSGHDHDRCTVSHLSKYGQVAKALSAANLALAEEAHRKLVEAELLIAAKDEKLARSVEFNFSSSLNDMDGLGWVFDDDNGLGIQSTCATSGEGLYSHNIANKASTQIPYITLS
ncbi:hypothetical protein RHMOL_Rhmol12G0047100 [Rhododendron molle]|uniref:Uncharacterized protein n=1 Tax=Rhododendron molle TaxID=49168 RepID=A0ACC0LFZ7_RHOML|nr:hypothetical protein RHMOL_Rhmol12G0047100 [Rhododendron molle]